MDMLRINICPQLTFYSFAVIFSLILAAVFCFQIGIDGIDRNPDRYKKEFLPIRLEGPLTSKLSNKGLSVKNDYELYRPLTALFVHIDMQHLASNCLMLIIWASYFEVFLTTYKTPIIFFVAGNLKRYDW